VDGRLCQGVWRSRRTGILGRHGTTRRSAAVPIVHVRTRRPAALTRVVCCPASPMQLNEPTPGGDSVGRYDPLRDFLAGRPPGTEQVRMTFADVEALVGSLPASACEHRAWWANDSKVEAQAWRAAGWHVDAVNQTAEWVVFARGRVGGTGSPSRVRPVRPAATRRLRRPPCRRPAPRLSRSMGSARWRPQT
jgi:hypothetical protein